MNDISPNTRVAANLTAAFSILGTVLFIGWWGGTTLLGIQNSITKISETVDRGFDEINNTRTREINTIKSDMDRRIREIQSKIVGKSSEGYHRADAADHCRENEKLNPNWKCADPYNTPRFRAKWGVKNNGQQ